MNEVACGVKVVTTLVNGINQIILMQKYSEYQDLLYSLANSRLDNQLKLAEVVANVSYYKNNLTRQLHKLRARLEVRRCTWMKRTNAKRIERRSYPQGRPAVTVR